MWLKIKEPEFLLTAIVIGGAYAIISYFIFMIEIWSYNTFLWHNKIENRMAPLANTTKKKLEAQTPSYRTKLN